MTRSATAKTFCGRTPREQRRFNLRSALGYLREARMWIAEGAGEMAAGCIAHAGWLSRRAPAAERDSMRRARANVAQMSLDEMVLGKVGSL